MEYSYPQRDVEYTKSLYKFICPICGEKNFQERLYDLNITKLKGRIRYQGTEFQLRELVLFLERCITIITSTLSIAIFNLSKIKKLPFCHNKVEVFFDSLNSG